MSTCRCRHRRHVPAKGREPETSDTLQQRKMEDERAQKILLKAADISRRMRDGSKQESVSGTVSRESTYGTSSATVRPHLSSVVVVPDPAGPGMGYVRMEDER
mmetsp:Transcript_9238/g.16638  ORF Transcript_9238/g.16638 Transcript_9238/m.16638 type:complete len:103 (-) Transcript_9238:44-352(-)